MNGNSNCHICLEPLGLLSNVNHCKSGSNMYSFHKFCFQDIPLIRLENINLKVERNGLRDVYDALRQSCSILDRKFDLKNNECQEKETMVVALENELKTVKGKILDLIRFRYHLFICRTIHKIFFCKILMGFCLQNRKSER
jgi:hypothetical protein